MGLDSEVDVALRARRKRDGESMWKISEGLIFTL